MQPFVHPTLALMPVLFIYWVAAFILCVIPKIGMSSLIFFSLIIQSGKVEVLSILSLSKSLLPTLLPSWTLPPVRTPSSLTQMTPPIPWTLTLPPALSLLSILYIVVGGTLIFRADHVSVLLTTLPCLPTALRIKFKFLIMAYKSLQDRSPAWPSASSCIYTPTAWALSWASQAVSWTSRSSSIKTHLGDHFFSWSLAHPANWTRPLTSLPMAVRTLGCTHIYFWLRRSRGWPLLLVPISTQCHLHREAFLDDAMPPPTPVSRYHISFLALTSTCSLLNLLACLLSLFHTKL